MAIKVFLSHQKADASLAGAIAARLKTAHQIESYLDVIDPYITRSGEDLADHIRSQMKTCTQLLAVVSRATNSSQWVPWEIGVATEKDFPLATFSGDNALPPEFLRKWPYLRTQIDLDRYATVSKTANRDLILETASFGEAGARRRSTVAFYRNLRRDLGQ